MNGFIDFKKLMPKAIERYQMTRETRAAHVCSRFREIAPEIIGNDVRGELRTKYFKNGTLYVSVPNSIWAQRVYVHRHDLIMKINLGMKKEYLNDIRAVVEGPVKDLG